MKPHSGGENPAPGEPRGEAEAARQMQAELRALPSLEPPPRLWRAIESRLLASGLAQRPGVRAAGRRPAWLGWAALRAAALAAVFVTGLALGRWTVPAGLDGGSSDGQVVSAEPGAGAGALTLPEAMELVRIRSQEYDAALSGLTMAAREVGVSIPSPLTERLAALDLLVEGSRTALLAEPADPHLNAYLFAALEQRENVIREMNAEGAGSYSEAVWK